MLSSMDTKPSRDWLSVLESRISLLLFVVGGGGLSALAASAVELMGAWAPLSWIYAGMAGAILAGIAATFYGSARTILREPSQREWDRRLAATVKGECNRIWAQYADLDGPVGSPSHKEATTRMWREWERTIPWIRSQFEEVGIDLSAICAAGPTHRGLHDPMTRMMEVAAKLEISGRKAARLLAQRMAAQLVSAGPSSKLQSDD